MAIKWKARMTITLSDRKIEALQMDIRDVKVKRLREAWRWKE